jgi:hypothetical protein
MTEDPDTRSGSICLGCGLCCDGTVVTHLAVSDESDLGLPLRGLGVELIYEADPPVFALPCPAVAAGECTIYELHRPHACHAYECALSTSVLNGERSPVEARRIIAEVLDARSRSGSDPGAERRVADLVAEYFLA